MIRPMEFTEMIEIATKLHKTKMPRTKDARDEFIEEASNDVDRIVEALEAMKDAAEELRDCITESGDAETMREFRDDYVDNIRDYAETLVDALKGVE